MQLTPFPLGTHEVFPAPASAGCICRSWSRTSGCGLWASVDEPLLSRTGGLEPTLPVPRLSMRLLGCLRRGQVGCRAAGGPGGRVRRWACRPSPGRRPTDRTVEPEVRYRGEGGTAGEHGALVCVPRWEDGRAQVPTVILGARQRGGGLSVAHGHGGPAGSHFHAVSFRLFFECPLKSCLREGKVTSEFFPAWAPCDAGPAPLGPSGEQPEEGVTWWTPCECGVTGVTVASPVSCLWAKPTHFL